MRARGSVPWGKRGVKPHIQSVDRPRNAPVTAVRGPGETVSEENGRVESKWARRVTHIKV